MKIAIGPGAVVAAAFIGPGTVTATTLAGANFGFALVWTLAFATVATIILQDMAARLGAGARLGLGEAMMQGAPSPLFAWAAAGLVLAALALGNAAYEAGNLGGAALGLEAALGKRSPDRRILVAAIGAFAALLLLTGRYRALERALITLVILMSLSFAAAFALVRPDLGALLGGLWPRMPEGGLLTAVALIGTTIVPYNLFLHAAAARERWSAKEGAAAARADTAVSIGFGGLISILVLATAATTLFGAGLEVTSAADMARAIEPVFGPAARYLIAAGLLAAGLTSAITAPMATGYAVAEILAPKTEPARQRLFRRTALAVLAAGVAAGLSGVRTVELILIAQAANGLLLPIVAVVLLLAMNRRELVGGQANGPVANALGGLVVLITFLLGARLVLRTLGVWP